jgi:hypothetical protein
MNSSKRLSDWLENENNITTVMEFIISSSSISLPRSKPEN